jgi:flagellar biosynthesis chaperone FliJ
MSTEIKATDVLNLLGLPTEASNLEEIREKFEQTYLPLEALKDPKNPHAQQLAPAFVGKVTGVATTTLKRKLKTLGVDLTAEEIKEKPLEQVLELGLERVAETHQQKIKSLEEQLNQSSDQKATELTAKLEKLQAKYNDTTALLEQARQQYDQERGQWENQLRGQRLEWARSKAHESIKWRPDVKEVEREGFFARLNRDYRLELDEQGRLEVLDSSGKRIPSGKQAHAFKTYEEVLEEAGRTLGVWAENPQAGRPVSGSPAYVVPAAGRDAATYATPQPGDGGRVRKMSGRLVRR